ncbi:50S ribosomal protein L3 [Bacteroidota bacterium]
MPSIRRPRSGSMQFWPRKRASRAYARIRSWVISDKAKPLGFIGYKVGMTHFIGIIDNKHSHLKGQNVAFPVTIVECPPIRIFSVRFYKTQNHALKLQKEIFFKTEKQLARKIKVPKETSKELESINSEDFDVMRLSVYTQPHKAGFGKKKPEIFEMALGGSIKEQITFLKANVDKEIDITNVFEENQLVDIHAITKGKGFQGPVKRFGIGLKPHKSEKGRRAPGSLGPWVRQQHISHRVAHAGQMGFYQRIDYHKQILKISNEVEQIGKDFHKYGNIKSTYIVLHGSIPGAKKRPIIMSTSKRGKNTKHQLTIQE